MAYHDCPSAEQLAAFDQGRLDDCDLLEAIGRHVTLCARCETTLEALESDELESQLRQAARFAVTDPPAALARLEARARAIPLEQPTLDRQPASDPAPSTPRTAPEPATGVIGQYELQQVVGRGGMGVVYRARHSRLKKTVALKVMSPAAAHHHGGIARFQREIESLGALSHPNIVNATDAGEADGRLYLVMEFVDGADLSTLVHRLGALPAADAAELVRQAAVGLQYVHERGLVHRDLKPSNLILSADGEVKILDLGLTLPTRPEDSRTREELTSSNQMMGTADYMAPEQWDDSHHVDTRADIYSLGCTLYRLLTGKVPFGGSGRAATTQKRDGHLYGPVPSARALRPDVPDGLDAVVQRTLQKAPNDRFATPAALAAALRPFCDGSDLKELLRQARACEAAGSADAQVSLSTADDRKRPPVTDPAAPRPEGKQPRRRLVAMGAAVVLLIAGIVAWAMQQPRQEERQEPEPEKPMAADAAEPKVWHDLLKRPPRNFFWWSPGPKGSWDFDTKTKKFWIAPRYHALVSLGHVASPNFKFRVTFRRDTWFGYAGIFFGGNKSEQANGVPLHFQRVQAYKKASGDFVLARYKGIIQKFRQDGNPVWSGSQVIADGPTQPPVLEQEHSLEMEVRGKNGLTRLRWNGHDVPELTQQMLNLQFQPADYVGDVGIACDGGYMNVTSACLMLPE